MSPIPPPSHVNGMVVEALVRTFGFDGKPQDRWDVVLHDRRGAHGPVGGYLVVTVTWDHAYVFDRDIVGCATFTEAWEMLILRRDLSLGR